MKTRWRRGGRDCTRSDAIRESGIAEPMRPPPMPRVTSGATHPRLPHFADRGHDHRVEAAQPQGPRHQRSRTRDRADHRLLHPPLTDRGHLRRSPRRPWHRNPSASGRIPRSNAPPHCHPILHHHPLRSRVAGPSFSSRQRPRLTHFRNEGSTFSTRPPDSRRPSQVRDAASSYQRRSSTLPHGSRGGAFSCFTLPLRRTRRCGNADIVPVRRARRRPWRR